jgi:hypothetical protein
MARAEVTEVKEGRIFVSVISPPINDADIVIEFHRRSQRDEPLTVHFVVLTREEFKRLLDDWNAFDFAVPRCQHPNPGLDCECGGKLHRQNSPGGAIMICDRCGQ